MAGRQVRNHSLPAEPPECLLDISSENVPTDFPKAETAKQTQNRFAARPYYPRQILGHTAQIRHAIQACKIRKSAVVRALLFEFADLLDG